MLRPHTVSSFVLAVTLVGVAWAGNNVENVVADNQRRLTIAQTKVESGARARNVAGGPISDYQQARPVFWRELYAGGGETLYCAQRFGARKGKSINIEHVFPMSWVTRHLRCGERDECRRASTRFNRIEADLHNLWPALKNVNKARRSHPFAVIKGEKQWLRGCDFEVDERRRVVEPREQARGEIARSMFYMAKQYGLNIRARQGETLKRWHRDDPVSSTERRRNDLIERLQGNRNSYIDDPRSADRLRF